MLVRRTSASASKGARPYVACVVIVCLILYWLLRSPGQISTPTFQANKKAATLPPRPDLAPRSHLSGVDRGATQIQSACRASLVNYHAVLSKWMAGTTELQYVDELWEAMDMGRDFVLVPPGAAEMHPASIRAVLLQARGSAGPSYFTEPRDIRCTGGEREEPATCDFVEWQHGKTSVRRVKGTGKCGWRADGKRVEWLRLKEVELTG